MGVGFLFELLDRNDKKQVSYIHVCLLIHGHTEYINNVSIYAGMHTANDPTG